GLIDNTRILSPTLVNEFRFGINHFFNDIGGELNFVRDPIKELNILVPDPPPIAWGMPSIGILGFSGFGDDSNSPYLNYNYTFQWTDNLSWNRGAHSMKSGADIRRDRFSQIGNQFPRSSPGFQNQATGYGFADYMLGHMYNNSDAAGLSRRRPPGTAGLLELRAKIAHRLESALPMGRTRRSRDLLRPGHRQLRLRHGARLRRTLHGYPEQFQPDLEKSDSGRRP